MSKQVKTKNENLKTIILKFDMGNESDKTLHQKIKDICNKVNHGDGVKMNEYDIIKRMINPEAFQDSTILKMKKESISNKHKLQLWLQGFNEKNNTQYKLEEFLVSCLPSIKEKELDKFVEKGLMEEMRMVSSNTLKESQEISQETINA